MRIAIPILFSATLLMILLCGCDNSFREEETTDVNESVIQAIDKSIPVTTGNLITKTKTDSESNIHVEYYDSVGNLVENYIWNPDEEIVSHSIITYTPENNVLKKEEIFPATSDSLIETFQYDANGNVLSKNISEYKNNRLSKSTNYDSQNVVTTYSLSTYNEDLLTKIEKFNKDGSLIEYQLYEYNESEQMIKHSTLDNKDNIIKYTLFDYNENNLIEKENYYSSDGILKNYNLYTYNDDGTRYSIISYNADGSILSEHYFNTN